MDNNPLLQEFWRLPKFTRFYLSSIVAAALLVHVGILSPLSLYLNDRRVIERGEYWRLLTTFLYFGPVNFDFVFHVFFLYRYCRSLEADSYYRKPLDFYLLCVFGAVLLLTMALQLRLTFLGPAFTFMLVYIWCRRNPAVMMNFLGIFSFRAPLMPWVLFAFSLLLSGSVPMNDLIGITAGHCYFFVYDLIPQIYHVNLLSAPKLLHEHFDRIAQSR